MDFITNIDNGIITVMQNNVQNSIFDRIMPIITSLGGMVLWLVIAGIFICTKKYRKYGVMMAIALIYCAIVGNLTLKPIVARIRPFDANPLIDGLLINAPTDFSFPSGHSMNGFTAAVTILFYNRRWGIAAVALAALIAFSRLYHFVHFPTDVFAGIVIGTMVACVTNVLFVWINKRKLNQHEKKNCRIR